MLGCRSGWRRASACSKSSAVEAFMLAPTSRSITTMLAALLVGGVLSACVHDSRTGDEPEVISGFVASPSGARYADSDQDTLHSMDDVAFPPLSVAIERVYAEEGKGVSWPDAGSIYIESILRTSTGKFIVNYVIEGERSSIDFEMSPSRSYRSLFGSTTHEDRTYGVQLYTDLNAADDFGPWNYVSTARWFSYNLRPGVTPYDGTVYELFGTYGVRTRPGSLSALGSATYQGNAGPHSGYRRSRQHHGSGSSQRNLVSYRELGWREH